MIVIVVGLPGSGKTSAMVREMVLNHDKVKWFSNIIPKKPELTPQMVTITKEMIVVEEVINQEVIDNKLRDGKNPPAPKIKSRLNSEYWKNIKEPLNVVIDEAHIVANARRSMSNKNIAVNEWISLIRRVLGSNDGEHGDAFFLTQRLSLLDGHIREMANLIRYHICHYKIYCKSCGWRASLNNEMPEQPKRCLKCNGKLIKKDFRIECFHFAGLVPYNNFLLFGQKTFFRHYFINDIEKYFGYYDTLQWDSLFN